MTEKNAPTSLAILMAMWIRRYNAEHIAQYGRSRATLDATVRRHQASIHHALPRPTRWSLILELKTELWRCENHFLKLAFKRLVYSAHRSNKLRRKVNHYDESGRTQLTF